MIYFISGSSKIKTLNLKMKKCLDNIINDKDAEVIVGDCFKNSKWNLYNK